MALLRDYTQRVVAYEDVNLRRAMLVAIHEGANLVGDASLSTALALRVRSGDCRPPRPILVNGRLKGVAACAARLNIEMAPFRKGPTDRLSDGAVDALATLLANGLGAEQIVRLVSHPSVSIETVSRWLVYVMARDLAAFLASRRISC